MLFCGPFPLVAKDALPRAGLSLSFFLLDISASDFFGGTLGGLRSSAFRFFFSAVVCGSCLTCSMVDRAAFAEEEECFSGTTVSFGSSSECSLFTVPRACFLPWGVNGSSSSSSSVSSSSSSSPSSAASCSSSSSSLSSSSPSN